MNWHHINGWFDYRTIYDDAVSKAKDGAIFVEVGAWQGKSTAYMAQAIEDCGKKIDFYSVDTWHGFKHGLYPGEVGTLSVFAKNMLACGILDFIRPLRMPSVQAARAFRDGSIDFCFIDGDHAYESVYADIEAWLPKIKEAGILAGHDYGEGGVQRAVDDFFQSGSVETVVSSWRVQSPRSVTTAGTSPSGRPA